MVQPIFIFILVKNRICICTFTAFHNLMCSRLVSDHLNYRTFFHFFSLKKKGKLLITVLRLDSAK